jgi:hypothetical protein
MINSYFTYYHLLLLDLLDKTVLVIADLLSFFGVCVFRKLMKTVILHGLYTAGFWKI